MDDELIKELSEVIQSSQINFLIGAGASTPYLPLLGNIEKALNKAKNNADREKHYKTYFKNIMLPNKKILREDLSGDKNYQQTSNSYKNFLLALSNLILKRKTTILSKQVNLFTTNIDIFLETVLEELQIEYNDGFTAKFQPTFGIENFKKSLYQRSLHFEHISELPVFNVIKMHGSLSWRKDKSNSKIIFSRMLNHIDKNIESKTSASFLRSYKRILIVNPEERKHIESVLNVYYSELLRMYSSELEKENALLIVIGFSMSDKHIKEITLRAANSNPTLRVIICCSKKSAKTMMKKMETIKYPNIQIFSTDKITSEYTLDYLTKEVLERVTLEY